MAALLWALPRSIVEMLLNRSPIFESYKVAVGGYYVLGPFAQSVSLALYSHLSFSSRRFSLALDASQECPVFNRLRKYDVFLGDGL